MPTVYALPKSVQAARTASPTQLNLSMTKGCASYPCKTVGSAKSLSEAPAHAII